jgi:UDP-N-acetylglucosamine--N-acetylmuramyl-(pentapeptide) pyrophosphoryl-undecaprenol N-acetylglucosamine transferase
MMDSVRPSGSPGPLADIAGPVGMVIAGGGTAGHVIPALDVAHAYALDHDGRAGSPVVFAGATGGQEGRLATEAGWPVALLDVTNFPRPLRPWPVVRSGWREATGSTRAWRLLGAWRPSVVLSVGGFASVPWVVAAASRRIPIVVLSYDAKPGQASRAQARVAKACAVAFASSPLPRAVHTGVPVRDQIAQLGAMDPSARREVCAEARIALGLPVDRLTVLVTGGSLGARSLNQATIALAERWADRGDVTIFHVTGRRNPVVPVASGGDGRLLHHVVDYEDRMPLAFAASDVVVARAGAMTVFELAAAGMPSIVVPWPLAAEDHQRANATALAGTGGAVMVLDHELTADRLAAELGPLLADEGRRVAMGGAARALVRPDAADAIADLCRNVASRPRGRGRIGS